MLRLLDHILCWLWIILLVGCQQENPSSQSTDQEKPAASDVTQSEESSSEGLVESARGEVVSVYDGDTCTLLVGKNQYKIRLEGIDTPEMDQAFGKRAKQALSGYIFGKQVTAQLSGKDRYERYLGTILMDGRNVNLQMVKDGCAWHYKKYSSDEILAQAESDARAARRGLWEDGDAMAPWDWRNKDSRKTAAKVTPGQELRELPTTVSHWLNTSSGIRHNRRCRQFGKTKAGRACGATEGRACKICGG